MCRAAREAVDARILVVDPTSTGYRFRHPLIAEAVHSTLLPGERVLLHGQIASRLASRDVTSAELAHHWAAARQPAEALTASLCAARDAEQVFGLAEALAHLERAIALWPSVPDAAARCGTDLATVLGQAAQLAGETGAGHRAVQLARQAIREVDAARQPQAAARLHVGLGQYLHQIGRTPDMVAAMRQAVAILPCEPVTTERAYALSSLAGALMVNWRHAESLSIAEQALRTAVALDAHEAVVGALITRGIDLAYLGRHDAGVSDLRRALTLSQASGDRTALHRAYVNLTDVLTLVGRPRDAAELARTGLAEMHRLGVRSNVLLANYLEALMALGDWAEAERQTTSALRSVTADFPYMIYMLRADLDIGRGDFDLAAARLDRARETLRPDHGYGIYEISHAELALWQRRWTDAVRHATDALSLARAPATEHQRVWFAAKALRAHAELAALARARRDTTALDRWFGRALDLITDARRSAATASTVTANAEGWLHLAEAELVRVTSDDGPSEPWRRAAGSWDRLERPPLAAYCRWRQAEALVHSGAPRDHAGPPLRMAYRTALALSAHPLRHELEALARRARIDPTPKVEAPPAPSWAEFGLTAREAQVLAQLVRGRTNREIACELTISEKTASVHVSHILGKLGADNRQKAAAIADRLMSSAPSAPDDDTP